MAELIVLRWGLEVKRVRLPDGELSLGRDKGCGLVIEDALVAPAHARVFKSPEGYVFEDFGSIYGSLIRGKRIMREVLYDGIRIFVGAHELVFSSR